SGASAFAWSMLVDTDEPERIARDIQAAGGETHADEVASWISRWRADDWLGRADRPGAPVRKDEWLSDRETLTTLSDDESLEAEAPIEAGGVRFRIRADQTDVLELALAPFTNLRAAHTSEAVRSARISITTEPAGYRFHVDNRYTDFCERVDEIAPMLKMWVFELILQDAPYDLVLHASALSRGDRLLLLAAASGSGKSTLSAALAARGFALHCDDCILFSGSGELSPIQFPVTLKAGSWPVLSDLYPELMGSPAYLRSDGLTVKYLSPAMAPMKDATPILIFPQFDPDTAFEVYEMHRADAVQHLLEDAHTSGLRMTCEQFEAFVGWMSTVSCLELAYSRIDDAEQALRAL
ncbi:MAG: hypothetical protein AAGL49_09550, partial [Pseudomonadota bacterium]